MNKVREVQREVFKIRKGISELHAIASRMQKIACDGDIPKARRAAAESVMFEALGRAQEWQVLVDRALGMIVDGLPDSKRAR